MARARNIKPGFYKNEDLAECSILARLIYPGLWMLADREGRLEDRPKRIKGELLPYDNADVDKLLGELERWGLIIRYEADGNRYIAIPKFLQHQNPHHREAESIIPPPNCPGLDDVGMTVKPRALVSCEDDEAQDMPEESPEKARPSRAESPILNPESPILNPESSSSDDADDDRDPENLKPPLPLARNVQIALLLRAQQIEATSQNPIVCVTWAQNPDVTDEVLNLAILKAKKHQGEGKSIAVKYLLPIVAQILAEQSAPPPTAEPQKAREDWSWSKSHQGIESKARELGIKIRQTHSYDDVKQLCFDEIRKRKSQSPGGAA
jgi:hypothetical protein